MSSRNFVLTPILTQGPSELPENSGFSLLDRCKIAGPPAPGTGLPAAACLYRSSLSGLRREGGREGRTEVS